MDQRLVVLKLFLDALGIPDEIATLDDRKRVQKAVYLGQVAGIDLGYRFGWYLLGPYSPQLARDYFALAEARALGESTRGAKLDRSVVSVLRRIQPLLTEHANCDLKQEDWLELVASVHYLRTVSSFDQGKARKVLKEHKPTLAKFVGIAEQKLAKSRLLP